MKLYYLKAGKIKIYYGIKKPGLKSSYQEKGLLVMEKKSTSWKLKIFLLQRLCICHETLRNAQAMV